MRRAAGIAVLVAAVVLPAWAGAAGSQPADAAPVSAKDALARVGLRPLGTYRKTVHTRVPFESVAEAQGWYVTPQTPLTHHQLSGDVVRRGKLAHKAWVTGPNTANIEPDGPNHRGYPTMQLFKRPRGCVTPCLLDLWVWADIPLRRGEWFSVATLTASTGSSWFPQTVNVGSEGWLHTMHVPAHTQSRWVLQRTDLAFPVRRWVRVRILVDYRSTGGGIAVWQNGKLMSVAPIDPTVDRNGLGVLNQVHFGMYTPPTIATGTIYNDALTISQLR